MTACPDWNRCVKPRRGYVYRAYDGEFLVTITRVSRDGSWADIVVDGGESGWRKRQTLSDGLLPFPAVIWETP